MSLQAAIIATTRPERSLAKGQAGRPVGPIELEDAGSAMLKGIADPVHLLRVPLG